MKVKKLISLILVCSMFLGCFAVDIYAASDHGALLNDDTFYGHRDVDFEVEEHKPRFYSNNGASNGSSADDLKSYSSVTGKGHYNNDTVYNGTACVTTVKNQESGSDSQTCWAFSATAASEATLIKNDALNYNKTNLDLSELQLIYFFYNTKIDPLDNASGDSTAPDNYNGKSYHYLNVGGNDVYTMWGLTNWVNGAPESILPYGRRSLTLKVDQKYLYQDDIGHVQNVRMIATDKTTTISNIKQAVLDYGALSCAYYYDKRGETASRFYYSTKNDSTSHAVTIVGFNDDIPASKFTYNGATPAGNGGWLIKNSWGSTWGIDGDDSYQDDFSGLNAEGYFWLSYYDKSLAYSEAVFAYDFEPASNYKYNYQYDGGCNNDTYKITTGNKVCAEFSVSRNNNDPFEIVKALGIGISSADVTVTAELYRGPASSVKAGNNPIAKTTITTTYPGFYTIDFLGASKPNSGGTYSETDLLFADGEVFTVAVSFNSDTDIFVDTSADRGWIKFDLNTNKDKTYLVSGSDSLINFNTININAGSRSSVGTARLKAYTVPAGADTLHAVSYDLRGGTGDFPAQIKQCSESIQLNKTIPTKEHFTFLGWAKSKEAAIAKQAEYKIENIESWQDYSESGNLTLYAVWKPNEGYEGLDYTVEVKVNRFLFIINIVKITVKDSSGKTISSSNIQYQKNSRWQTGNSFIKLFSAGKFNIRVKDKGNTYEYNYPGSGTEAIYSRIVEKQ